MGCFGHTIRNLFRLRLCDQREGRPGPDNTNLHCSACCTSLGRTQELRRGDLRQMLGSVLHEIHQILAVLPMVSWSGRHMVLVSMN